MDEERKLEMEVVVPGADDGGDDDDGGGGEVDVGNRRPIPVAGDSL